MAAQVKTATFIPEIFEAKSQAEISKLSGKGAHERWLRKDTTLWTNDENHKKVILNRLGWVNIAEEIKTRLSEIDALKSIIVESKVTDLVLLGMGGSSLAAEVFSEILKAPKYKTKDAKKVRFHLLDTTDPAAITKVERATKVQTAFYLVGSKSGSTIETRSQYQYFFDKVKKFYKGDEDKAAGRFIIVTDFDSPLETLAKSKPFAALFLNPKDIGGRYSALSMFGLVPAAILGIDVRKVLADANRFLKNMREEKDLTRNEGIRLGIQLGTLALEGKDKLTFWTSPELASFADWAEQLIAESTGKDGKGITPVATEPILSLDKYGSDRVFVILRLKGENEKIWNARIKALREKGFPVFDFVWEDGTNVGGEFLRWEVATSFASVVSRVNPFDEPNVTESKNITKQLLEDIKKKKKLSAPSNLVSIKGLKFSSSELKKVDDFFASLPKNGFVSVLAYIERNLATRKSLKNFQKLIASSLKVPTLSGFGPRYLHSIGQLYKGGPKQGIYIEFFVKDVKDLKIAGEVYGFSQLKQAQALGDYKAITSKGLPVLAVDLGNNLTKGLTAFYKKLATYFSTKKW